MAFTTLAQLYDEQVAKLYHYNPRDFNSGEPLYQNKLVPGPMSDAIKHDSRSLPITSTIRDIQRMAKYSVSGKGLLFLATQQLLQSGNAFGQTTIINPAFVIANTVPFIHMTRNISGIRGTTPTIRGRLQTTTGVAAIRRSREILSFGARQRAVRSIGGDPLTSFIAQIKGTVSNIAANLNPSSATFGVDQRPDIDHYDSLLDQQNRLNTISSAINDAVIATLEYNTAGVPLIKETPPAPSFDPVGRVIPLVNLKRDYDHTAPKTATIRSYEEYKNTIRTMYTSKTNSITGKKELSYMNDRDISAIDPANVPTKQAGVEYTPDQLRKIYEFTNVNSKDFIKVYVAVPSKSKRVQFRAFIKDIRHSVKPEYSTSKYIGRTEKYVSYSGTSRVVSFVLTLVAFSKEEMDGLYTRLNYLMGLTYPLGYATGGAQSQQSAPQLLQPPMITLTIGNILKDQPGYFESVSVQYSDTYDLDLQLPMLATVTVSYAILEKEIMFYTNPTVGAFQTPREPSAIDAPDTTRAAILRQLPISIFGGVL